jgi:hypothetical protein
VQLHAQEGRRIRRHRTQLAMRRLASATVAHIVPLFFDSIQEFRAKKINSGIVAWIVGGLVCFGSGKPKGDCGMVASSSASNRRSFDSGCGLRSG